MTSISEKASKVMSIIKLHWHNDRNLLINVNIGVIGVIE